MIDIKTMAEVDRMAIRGFNGERMPDVCYKDEFLASAWRVGKAQAEDKARLARENQGVSSRVNP